MFFIITSFFVVFFYFIIIIICCCCCIIFLHRYYYYYVFVSLMCACVPAQVVRLRQPQILVVTSQMLKFHFVGLLCLAHYARAGENYILQKGPMLRSDQRRLSKRLYPHNNATADSLQRYKKDVPNGNDYNLVGDNVGDLLLYSSVATTSPFGSKVIPCCKCYQRNSIVRWWCLTRRCGEDVSDRCCRRI